MNTFNQKKLKKIILNSGSITKIYSKKTSKYNVREVYIVSIKGKFNKEWRQHLNAKKILICLSGKIIVHIRLKNKILKKLLIESSYIEIPKKKIFRFGGYSNTENNLLVLSDLENKKLKTNNKFNF